MNSKRKIIKNIAALYRRQSAILNYYFKDLGISSGVYPVIMAVYKDEGLSLKEVSERVFIDKAATTKFVNNLVEKEMVIKKKDSSDKRIFHLFLTEKGKKAYDALTKEGQSYTKNLFSKDIDIDTEKLASDLDMLLEETNKIYKRLKKGS